jgi:stearoyl-CoA desaturase (delta-9 desaturase)
MFKKIIEKIDPDLFLKNHLTTKLKFLWLFSFIVTSIWMYTTNLVWWQLLIIFYISVVYYRISTEVAYHRYFAHRSFKTSKLRERLLLTIGTLLGVGSCLSWVAMHRAHHEHSDTEKDPHSPLNEGVVRAFFTMRNKKRDYKWKLELSKIKDLIRDPLQTFVHKNYFKIVLSWILILSLLSYVLNSFLPLVMLFCLPCTMLWIMSGVTNSLGHWIGYRNFSTNDNSRNQHTVRWLLLATGLHNNHHYKPSSACLNIRNKWWEFDFDYFLIKLFFEVDKKSLTQSIFKNRSK